METHVIWRRGYSSKLPNSIHFQPYWITDTTLTTRHRRLFLFRSRQSPPRFSSSESPFLLSSLFIDCVCYRTQDDAMTIFSVQSTIFTRASVSILSSNGLKRFSFASSSSFSSNALHSSPLPKTKKRRFPIVSAVDIGGVTIARNGSCLSYITEQLSDLVLSFLKKLKVIIFWKNTLWILQRWWEMMILRTMYQTRSSPNSGCSYTDVISILLVS